MVQKEEKFIETVSLKEHHFREKISVSSYNLYLTYYLGKNKYIILYTFPHVSFVLYPVKHIREMLLNRGTWTYIHGTYLFKALQGHFEDS